MEPPIHSEHLGFARATRSIWGRNSYGVSTSAKWGQWQVIISTGENKPLGTVGIYVAPGSKRKYPCLAKTSTKTAMLTSPQHCRGQHLTSRPRTDKDNLCPSQGPCISVPRTHMCLLLEEGCLSLSVPACRLGPMEL